MNNQSNTHEGNNIEHLFANSILDHQSAWNSILQSIGHGAAVGLTPSIKVVGSNKRKADVVFDFGNTSNLAPIRVSVKSFLGAGYNHLERRNLLVFCQRNQISEPNQNFLKSLWLRKARNSGKGLLVKPEERTRVQQIFTGIEPGISAVLGNDHPQILALYSKSLEKWHLYNIPQQVEPLIRSQGITFTPRASNIKIGDYVVIQRKGSAAGESGSDINHISHGANHVQIKMLVKKFFNDIEPVSWYKL